MQFQVPQFIDIEDKIFGPFSFKQFLYLLGGAGGAFVLYRTLPIFIAIPLIIPVLALAGALTFYKVNGKPFVFILQSYFTYLFQSKLYVWKMRTVKKNDKKQVSEAPEIETNYIPKLSSSKLKDISWSLDVLDIEKNKENKI